MHERLPVAEDELKLTHNGTLDAAVHLLLAEHAGGRIARPGRQEDGAEPHPVLEQGRKVEPETRDRAH
eukprot:scaffold46171_cov29-Tisochrysis_lutea.AAC.11